MRAYNKKDMDHIRTMLSDQDIEVLQFMGDHGKASLNDLAVAFPDYDKSELENILSRLRFFQLIAGVGELRV